MTAVVHEIELRLQRAATPADRLPPLLDLAHAHASALRNREGLRAAREALQLARARGDNVSVCRALSAATLCHYQRFDFVSAVATGLDAISAYAEGDLRGRSGAQQSIALALFCVGDHDLAQATARRAIADAQACVDERCEAAARDVLGLILARGEHFIAARREFRQAGAVYGRRGDDARVKKNTANLGNTYREQGNFESAGGRAPQARFYWHQALRVYRIALEQGAGERIDALILGHISECELRLGRPAAAREAIARALENAISCPTILAPCHLRESEVLQALGDLKAAERACESARHAAERLEHGELLGACLAAGARIADQLGRFETAADFERRAGEVAGDRALLIAGVRSQLALLWDRHADEAPRNGARDAA
jgi:tetratricopeptide (TPR) repeat protein